MPISVEQWRVATGLVNARYAPCTVRSAASPCKYMSGGTLFLRACVAVLQALLILALDTDWWGPWVESGCGHNVKGHVEIVVVHLHGSGSEGQSSVRFYVSALRILLIIAGDVEENPGPPKLEGGVRPSLPQLLKELGSYADWEFLGLFLRIDDDTITSIRSSETEVKRQCLKLFRVWLQTSPAASWEELCRALEDSGDKARAHSLREKYCHPVHQQAKMKGTRHGEGKTELSGTRPVAGSCTKDTSTATSQAPSKTHTQSTPSYTVVTQQEGGTLMEKVHSLQLQVQKLSACTSPSTRPPQSILPGPLPSLPPIDEYASYLKSVYMSKKFPTYSKWPPTSSKKYIHLAVVKKQKVSEQEANEFTRATIHGNINDILLKKEPVDFSKVGIKEDGSSAKFILVEGAPGIGKTTFAWKICRCWAKSKILTEYKLVILLRLRDKRVREATTVFDLIYHSNTDIRRAVSRELEISKGRSLFLLFEGYDELPGKLQTEQSIFLDILYKNFLPEATVLVTSRPSATDFLHWSLKEQVSQHIEILGFTKEDIQSYILSVMDDSQVQEDFTQYLKCYPYIYGMMYVPLNAVIVAEVYITSRESPNKFIPTTMTEIYTALTKNLLLRYLFSHSEYGKRRWRLRSFTDLPEESFEQFCKVCTIAFNGMIHDEFIFDDLPENFNTLDLMQSSPELFVKEGALVSYNFFHLTLQEYLAAVHISYQRPEEQIEYFRGSFQKVFQSQISAYKGRVRGRGRGRAVMAPLCYQRTETVTEYSHHTPQHTARPPTSRGHLAHKQFQNSSLPHTLPHGPPMPPSLPVLTPTLAHTTGSSSLPIFQSDENLTLQRFKISLRFAAGLTKFENLPLALLRSLLLRGREISLDALHWLFEAQCTDTYSKAIGTISLQYSHVGRVTPLDCFVLGHAVSHINCTWTVNLLNGHIGSEGLEMLVAGTHYNKGSFPRFHLPVSLDLSYCEITPESLHYLTEMSEHVATSVTNLDLGINTTGGGAAYFFSKLSVLRSLKTLHFPSARLTSEDTKVLGEFLSQSDSQPLELLNLNDNPLTAEGTGWILGALPHNSTLKELYLDGSHICMENVSSLTRALRGNCGLKRLWLKNCKIDTDTASEIASALCENSTIEKLDFDGNPIGPQGAAAFADMLRKNRTIQELNLRDDSIGKKGAYNLAKSLQYSTTLSNLWMPLKYKSSLPPALYSTIQDRLK